jgi:hypothetical protein
MYDQPRIRCATSRADADRGACVDVFSTGTPPAPMLALETFRLMHNDNVESL